MAFLGHLGFSVSAAQDASFTSQVVFAAEPKRVLLLHPSSGANLRSTASGGAFLVLEEFVAIDADHEPRKRLLKIAGKTTGQFIQHLAVLVDVNNVDHARLVRGGNGAVRRQEVFMAPPR